jgi:glyoxylase-like metal-dependent hydrolase (beta-lactamase superfamily II)
MKKAVSVLLVCFAGILSAQEGHTQFKSTEVVPGIYMIEGADGFVGGNMSLLVGEDYVAMVDDGIVAVAPALNDYVTEKAGRPVNFMINTHVHGDHVGGNAYFVESGTVVFAHENIRKRLLPDPGEAGGSGGLPVVTFAQGVTFHLNGIEARVMHAPLAHTDGDAFLHFPGVNVIHASDVLFHSLFPYIDLDNGGTVDGYIAAMKKILSLADEQTRIIPGHGTLTDKAGMKSDLAMLLDSRERVRNLARQGKTEDEVVDANPLADYHDGFNWNFITTERMTRTLYRDLEISGSR